MESLKRQISISRIFASYLFIFCVGTLALPVLLLEILLAGMRMGVILPANYYEKQIEQKRELIESSKVAVDKIIPGCQYVIYDFSGNFLEGSIQKKDAAKIWEDINRKTHTTKNCYYQVIKREKDVCIVLYSLTASYKNIVLQKYLPKPEICLFILFFWLFILGVFTLAHFFGKLIFKEMSVLQKAVKSIQIENLDFEIEHSKIIEVNEILSALLKMKDELQHSLNQQWEMEHARKEQIAALAHDIKTPLTILRGNAELLEETAVNREQEEYNQNILSSIDDMEKYMKMILDINQSEKSVQLNVERIELQHFIDEVMSQSRVLAKNKKINIIKEQAEIPEAIDADRDALKRAVMNVITNAIEYSAEKSTIIFSVSGNGNMVRLSVEDSGRGFSKEELMMATEKFYRGDKSRSSKVHYGMGLYIVKRFIELHHGNMSLCHSEKLGGAKVILEIPIKGCFKARFEIGGTNV